LVLALASSPALGQTRDARGAAGLRVDVERILSSEESGGWFVDRFHYDAIYPNVLQSFCRASPEARSEVMARVAIEQEQAGDPRLLFERSGKVVTSEVEKAAHLWRMRHVLEMAQSGAEKDCPFWVQPKRGYDGRQTDRNRFTLSLETGGLLQIRHTQDNVTYGGGGVVRLLPGYGFGHVSVLAGIEFAGGAMLRQREGESGFVVNYFPAIPVLVRVHSGNWHFDFEGAAVSLFQADDGRFSHGARAGFAVGLSALRTRFIVPWAGAAIAYEHYFPGGGRPAADFVRAGLRVGFVWDP
jgi:hypothetical protein